MARTRQLHPEFFKHEDLCALSPLHRLLFQGMWCEADREGRLEDRPKRLKASWLPYDQADGDQLVADLAAAGHILRYSAGGQRILLIPSFKRWQKVHPSEVESKLPGPPEDSTRSENSLHQESDPTPPGLRNPPLSSLPSQSSLPSLPTSNRAAVVAPPADVQVTPPDRRVSGKELRELWNAVAKPPCDLPPWAVMPPGQEMQADLLALEFDRAIWQAAFDRIRRSAFLNGHGKAGWLLTPAKLLAKGRPFVTAVLNGEYSGGGDLREEPTQPVRAAETAPRLQCIAPGCDASAAPGMPCHEHMQMLNDARVPWVTMGQAELVEALGKLEAQAVDALGAPS